VSVFFEKVMALREDAVTAFCELHSLCLGHPDLQVPDFINFRFSRNVLRQKYYRRIVDTYHPKHLNIMDEILEFNLITYPKNHE
jgi:hypothetical protein